VSNRLYRSPADRVIGGVAGGLAVWLNIDPSLVRIAWVLLAIFSGGIFLLVYFVMMLVVPLPPAGWVPPQPQASPGPGAGPSGWQSPDGGASAGASGAAPGGWQAPDGAAPSSAPGVWPASGPPPQRGPSQVNSGNAGIVVGIVLIVLGAWFLVDQYLDLDWALLWPVMGIALGVVLIVGAMRRARSGG
jgi:phage shock protein C